MPDLSPVSIAISRFGFPSLRAGGMSEAAARAALLRDLDPGAALVRDPLPSTQDGLRAMVAKRQIVRAMKAGETGGEMGGGAGGDTDPATLAQQRIDAENRPSFERELRVALRNARRQSTGITERLVLHWSNQFTVSSVKGKVNWSIGPYAREVVRPHVLGKFEAMLTAAVTHPSMLYYLDNAGSIGPRSIVGTRRDAGLNENLAREMLELHTLGVDGGYAQADVTALARILTGWTVDIRPGSPHCGTTIFDPRQHEPGPKQLLGRTIAEGGRDELTQAIALLARHPATATNVARRMAIGFLDEAPPAPVVAALADNFRATGGDLHALARTLVGIEAMWTTPPRKIRQPIELLYSADRLLGALPVPPGLVLASTALGQPFLRAPSPKGWAEENEAWLSPDGIKSRLDWAAAVGAQFGDSYPALPIGEATRSGAIGAATGDALGGAESPVQALALLLMSPEFQRR